MSVPWSGRQLTYRHALTLLGVGDSTAMRILNRLVGVGVAVLDVATVGALAFLDVRDEAVVWGNALASTLRERVTGVSRLDRTQRLTAAHAVIVITSFYEALEDIGLADLAKAELTAREQTALATESSPLRGHDRRLAEMLLDSSLPMPAPDRPFESVARELHSYYDALTDRLLDFISGLAAFEHHGLRSPHLSQRVADRAVARYEMAYRRLAADVPEFAVWASLASDQATRSALGTLGGEVCSRLDSLATGLAGVRELLAATSSGACADARRTELARSYRSYLDKPILDSREAPEGVVLPLSGAAYVNPAARVATAPEAARVATESWWANAPAVPDIQAFLIGHLTSPQATQAPLVVLGQPGSGKSILTRMLAANLPEADFLPIRVELRAVASDASIQEQTRQAVYAAIDRQVEWPDLVASAPGALPVVMLDGFDELLQATGTHQADYLERARDFQQREADLGRPLAIIVTSRTAVADRARFPRGSIAVRLEPFDVGRVRLWLAAWAHANATVLAARSLRPLTAEAALAQGELAGEPLLLLMLALYDAGANSLQREGSSLNRAELYERLMTDFARREVRKHHPELPDEQERHAIERELRQLGIAALAMFNRGQQIVSEAELDADLGALAIAGSATGGTGARSAPTAAETLVGRFFFIHEPTARRGTETVERSFEFLHATFGEFLVARLITRALLDLVDDRMYQEKRAIPAPLDAGFLHAAISFDLLSSRAPIIEFTTGLFGAHDAKRRSLSRSLLIEFLRDAFEPHPQWTYQDYQPVHMPLPARCAAYSANLVLLAVFSQNSPIDGTELIPDPWSNWDAMSSLWNSQLLNARTLTSAIRVSWTPSTAGNIDERDRPRFYRLGKLSIFPRDDSPVRVSEIGNHYSQAIVERDHTEPDGMLFEDFVVGSDTELGQSLIDAAFFGDDLDVEGLIPLWRHVSDDSIIPLEDFSDGNACGSPRRLLLELALAQENAFSPGRRAAMYVAIIDHGSAAYRRMAARLLMSDLRNLTAIDASNTIFGFLNKRGAQLPSTFFDLIAEYALRFGTDTPAHRPFIPTVCELAETSERFDMKLRAAFASVKLPYPGNPDAPAQQRRGE